MARPNSSRLNLAFELSCVAGFVDAVGYLALYRVFVANMSGNTIAVGIGLAHSDWESLLRRGAAIPVFVLGMLLSKCALYATARRPAPLLPSFFYILEALLLGIAVLVGNGISSAATAQSPPALHHYLLVSVLSVAMGLQNAFHTHFGPFNLHTTHVTGTLAKLTDELAHFLVALPERNRRRSLTDNGLPTAAAPEKKHLRNAAMLAIIWLCYLAGAATGGFFERNWQFSSLLLPMTFLLFRSGIELIKTAQWRGNHFHPGS
jgi:uncharacterized membrane protein YoaK (UPF0700 family)